jgi:hypothetical protein
VADVTFLVNQIRERDPHRGLQLEEQIRQAVGAIEPGIESDPFFSVRIGQSHWARRLPPLSLETSPTAVGLLLTRMLRRYRRPSEA